MRRLMIVLLLLTVTSTYAQDEFSPGEPVLVDVSIRLFDLAWSADSSTLWIEGEKSVDGSDVTQGYVYDVTSNKLTELEESPFSDILSPEEQTNFQTKDAIFTSPYDTDIIYGSTLYVPCGNECNGQLIMAGTDTRDLTDIPSFGFYKPLDFTNQGGFQVYWSRDGEAAVVGIGLNYGGGLIYYHVRLDGDYEDIIIDFGEVVDSEFFALSADGSRVLYRDYNDDYNLPELRLGEIQSIQFDHTQVSSRNVQSLVIGETVTGANFIEDSSDILYVNESGIQRRSSTLYGTPSLLNPDINSSWAHWVAFSPDNQYAAVLADGNLYVMPTEIDLAAR